MSCLIKISNLRNIKKLEFEMPDKGVWLLSAGNGGGKTSLLGCIRRIGQSNAFATHFPASLQSDRLDNQSLGSITYTINNKVVEYAYRGERWTPRPRSNASLFANLNYPSVLYIGATADRITPRPEDFDTSRIRKADKHIIDAANSIFETEKYFNLRTTNLTRGSGNSAFVLSLGGTPKNYHSEKHFSLGELCILKLLKLIKDCAKNSLIIIDELEMALHPRAQVKLLKYLENQAQEKSLTIIFSTHSVTLLKTIKKSKIIYLEMQEDNEIKVIKDCYPTYAIGNIAYNEEALPDIIISVEDEFAHDIVTHFFDKYVSEKYKDFTARPTLKVVPIGSFNSVVKFLRKNKQVIPSYVIQKAILDQDVLTESVKNFNDNQKRDFNYLENDISYLPFTPELGIISYIHKNKIEFERKIRERLNDHHIRLDETINNFDSKLEGAAARNDAKRVMRNLIDYLNNKYQKSEDMVRYQLCSVFASCSWDEHKNSFKEIFGPMCK